LGSQLQALVAIAEKDFVAAWRAKRIWAMGSLPAVLLVFIFYAVFRLRSGDVSDVVTAALWIAFALSGMLILSYSFIQERNRGSLDGLLLSPAHRAVIYLAKWLPNWFFISLVQTTILLLTSAVFGINLLRVDLLLIMVISAAGYSGVGTLLSAVASHSRSRTMMLGAMLLPVAFPLFMVAAKASSDLLHGDSLSPSRHWLQFVSAFSFLSVVLSTVLFNCVVEER
jgi:heme exporter protein B